VLFGKIEQAMDDKKKKRRRKLLKKQNSYKKHFMVELRELSVM